MLFRIGIALLWFLPSLGIMAWGEVAPGKGCNIPTFQSQPAAAIEACTSFLKTPSLSDQARAEALKIRARSLHTIGRLDEAIADYELALRLAPDDPELHLRRGWTAYDQQDFDLVFSQAEEALRLKPGYAAVYELIGTTLSLPRFRRYAQARAAFNEAIQADPEEPSYRDRLLMLLANWNEVSLQDVLGAADALLQLPVASISKPNAIEYYRTMTSYRTAATIERGKVLATLGRLDDARKSFDQAIADDPGALTYAWKAAFLFEHSALPTPIDQVQADLDRSLAYDGNYWFSLGLAGRVHLYGKNYEAAAAEFAHSIELYPINGTMRWRHATTLRLLGRIDEAMTEAVTAFQVDPGFMAQKIPDLAKYGFVLPVKPNADPRPMLYDAARACMLDERCG